MPTVIVSLLNAEVDDTPSDAIAHLEPEFSSGLEPIVKVSACDGSEEINMR
jgi:hypothetical protein